MLAQHFKDRHAEMAGADQGNPHSVAVRQESDFCPSINTSPPCVTTAAEGVAGYQQRERRRR
jgi:hypothetical protein